MQRRRREDGAETGGMQPRAQRCRGNHQKLKRQGRTGGSAALPTPGFRTPGLQNWERINFCCLKALSLWLCCLFQWPREANAEFLHLYLNYNADP